MLKCAITNCAPDISAGKRLRSSLQRTGHAATSCLRSGLLDLDTKAEPSVAAISTSGTDFPSKTMRDPMSYFHVMLAFVFICFESRTVWPPGAAPRLASDTSASARLRPDFVWRLAQARHEMHVYRCLKMFTGVGRTQVFQAEAPSALPSALALDSHGVLHITSVFSPLAEHETAAADQSA